MAFRAHETCIRMHHMSVNLRHFRPCNSCPACSGIDYRSILHAEARLCRVAAGIGTPQRAHVSRTSAHAHVCAQTHHMRKHTHAYTHTHTHICAHAHAHTRTRTRIHTCLVDQGHVPCRWLSLCWQTLRLQQLPYSFWQLQGTRTAPRGHCRLEPKCAHVLRISLRMRIGLAVARAVGALQRGGGGWGGADGRERGREARGDHSRVQRLLLRDTWISPIRRVWELACWHGSSGVWCGRRLDVLQGSEGERGAVLQHSGHGWRHEGLLTQQGLARLLLSHRLSQHGLLTQRRGRR